MACGWLSKQYYRYNNITPLAMLDWWEKALFSTSDDIRCGGVRANANSAGVADSVVLAGAAVSAYFMAKYAPDVIEAVQAQAAAATSA